jgi:hypothetical protein
MTKQIHQQIKDDLLRGCRGKTYYHPRSSIIYTVQDIHLVNDERRAVLEVTGDAGNMGIMDFLESIPATPEMIKERDLWLTHLEKTRFHRGDPR